MSFALYTEDTTRDHSRKFPPKLEITKTQKKNLKFIKCKKKKNIKQRTKKKKNVLQLIL